MASALNKVFLMGNLTRDPELRYTPSGVAVANIGMALNRVYTNQSGEKKEEVCYVKVVAWTRLAEICAEYLSKGSPLFVEGRLQSRSWETEQGQKRNTLEIVADNIQFIGRKETSKTDENFSSAQGAIKNQDNTAPEKHADKTAEQDFSIEEQVPF